ncbi:hypothetical protein FRB99_006910 [Tulasnella sp. 403]|nr:hypothetical protein FRB99_006910 [Tulasnella sp. 403]
MHSISDLTTFARKTKGHVPPQLVGASTTVVGNKMYLFGGRLVSQRRMVSDLYVFDLEKFVWHKVEPSPDEQVPGARYFHSADSYRDQDNDLLVLFGGMGYVAPDSDELCVLNDVRLFDLKTMKWRPPTQQTTLPPDNNSLVPRARYAHLSSITSDRLFIIGGQDMTNVWLDDIHVFDLIEMAWVQRQDYPRHCGTYRSVAVASRLRVRLPMEERRGDNMGLLGPPGSRFRVEGVTAASPTRVISDKIHHLPYSADPTPDFPNDILLYSNYNFTDVRRELEVISPEEPSGFTITDRSDAMTGVSLPPGLRFPTGAILGSHLIIAGTYLAHSYQSFSIWALDLQTMAWMRIDAGTTLASGSWSRGVLWPAQNKFLIFGNRDGNLVEDYNRRLLSWDHVAYIDLEAFGIYQPPRALLDLTTQELGLAALEEGALADFEVVCDDGRRIPCSRQTLETRWPWFAAKRRDYLAAARRAMEAIPASMQNDSSSRRPAQPSSSSSRREPPTSDRDHHHHHHPGSNGQARPRGMSDVTRLRDTGGATSGTEGYTSSVVGRGVSTHHAAFGKVGSSSRPPGTSSSSTTSRQGTTKAPRRPTTADSAIPSRHHHTFRTQLSVDTTNLSMERKMSLPSELHATPMSALDPKNVLTARDVEVAPPSSAVDAPTAAPFVVVSVAGGTEEEVPHGQYGSTIRTRARAMTVSEVEMQQYGTTHTEEQRRSPQRIAVTRHGYQRSIDREDEYAAMSSAATSVMSTPAGSDLSDEEDTPQFPLPPGRSASLSPTRTPLAAYPANPRLGIRRKMSELSVSASSSSSSNRNATPVATRRRAGSDATASVEGPQTPPVGIIANGGVVNAGGFVANVPPAEFHTTGPPPARTLGRIDEAAGGTTIIDLSGKTTITPDSRQQHLDVQFAQQQQMVLPDMRRPSLTSIDGRTADEHDSAVGFASSAPSLVSSSSRMANPFVHSESDLLDNRSRPVDGQRRMIPVQRTTTNTTSSADSTGYHGVSPPAPPTKHDRAVQRAREKLEKLERKAQERADKEKAALWEKEEKRRKKNMVGGKPDPQIMAERMRYMGVLAFAK